ncbi:hypothetical protein BD560DRAFT_411677 [Blakeslea trispora]|nr:hypothetical protein BD560DRAFT_411677 [Blakeslea trispora]
MSKVEEPFTIEGVAGEWDLFIYSVDSINKVSKRLNTPPFNVMYGRKLNDFKNYNEETGTTTPLTQEQVDQRIRELQDVMFLAILRPMG